jgi:hypothetical protein
LKNDETKGTNTPDTLVRKHNILVYKPQKLINEIQYTTQWSNAGQQEDTTDFTTTLLNYCFVSYTNFKWRKLKRLKLHELLLLIVVNSKQYKQQEDI